jgi:tryptophan halogenase
MKKKNKNKGANTFNKSRNKNILELGVSKTSESLSPRAPEKPKETKNITIVGGGSAGWMTATTLLNQFPEAKITLVESPNTPTIGVGESTVAGSQSGFNGIVDWLKLVGIQDSDWMPHCDAIHKLSIAFKDWYRKDSGTFHFPFGEPRITENNFGLKDWHIKKIFYPETPVSDYAESFYPGMALVNQNKSLHYKDEEIFKRGRDRNQDQDVQQYTGWSYQFDATKFGIWLRDHYCKARHPNNFTHIQAEVEEIPLDDNGIKHLVLDNGQKLEADLFIDCTGFKSLLLSKTFDVSFISIEKYIPNNYAWATKIPYRDPETQIVNYTNCTAIENGWIWEIPLWSRMGSGYVFSDKFVSSEEALEEFKRGLIKKGYENVEDLEYHLIPMRTGIQEKLWVKNTCAIGLSAAFIEPLQSNGLQSIYQFLFNLIRTLARGNSISELSEFDRREFTAKCQDDFYSQAFVVALSYVLSHRDDTEYWRDLKNRDWPEEIFNHNANDISKFFYQAYIDKNFRGSIHPMGGAHCMATGMEWSPQVYFDGQIRNSASGNSQQWVEIYKQESEKRKKQWNDSIKHYPSPYKYLKENVHKNT